MAIRRTLDLAELFSTYEDADVGRSLLEVSYEHKEGHYQSFCISIVDLLNMYFSKYGDQTSFTMSFDGNGGSGYMPSQDVELNQQVDVPECEFTYAKHDFVNWLVQIGFNNYYFEPGSTLDVPNRDITLVAQWQDFPKFNVYFRDQYNNTLAPTQSILQGDKAKKPADPQIPGYDFVSDSWTLNGQPYDFNSPVTQQLTIIGETIPKKFTVAFDPNGGSVSPSSKIVTFGQVYGQLPIPEPPQTTSGDQTQYAFNCWQNDEVQGKTVTEYTKVQIPKDHTLTASWKPIDISITVYPNGGSGQDQQIDMKSGDDYTPFDYGFTKDRHELVGFSEDKSASTPEYPLGESKVVYSSLILYAVWKLTIKDIAAQLTTSGGKVTCTVIDPSSGASVYYAVATGSSSPSAWKSGNVYTASKSCRVYFKVEADGYHALGDDYTFGKKLVLSSSIADQQSKIYAHKSDRDMAATALKANGYSVQLYESRINGSTWYGVKGTKYNYSWTVSGI